MPFKCDLLLGHILAFNALINDNNSSRLWQSWENCFRRRRRCLHRFSRHSSHPWYSLISIVIIFWIIKLSYLSHHQHWDPLALFDHNQRSQNIFLQKHQDVAQVAEVKPGAVVDLVVQKNKQWKHPQVFLFWTYTLIDILPLASSSKTLTAWEWILLFKTRGERRLRYCCLKIIVLLFWFEIVNFKYNIVPESYVQFSIYRWKSHRPVTARVSAPIRNQLTDPNLPSFCSSPNRPFLCLIVSSKSSQRNLQLRFIFICFVFLSRNCKTFH